jgi:predicted Abi (CAAX) family protease
MPHWRTWRACAAVYALFLACAVPIGLLSGLLRPSAPLLPPPEMIGAGLLLFVQPALIEEIIFRGLLLPRDFRSMRGRRLIVMSGSSLALYVAAHPVAARLFRPEARSLFESPVYLTLAALLGLACTATYFISRSIWPPVAIHWLTVVTWIWFLGGQALLC